MALVLFSLTLEFYSLHVIIPAYFYDLWVVVNYYCLNYNSYRSNITTSNIQKITIIIQATDDLLCISRYISYL